MPGSSRRRQGPFGVGVGGWAQAKIPGLNDFTQGNYDLEWRDCTDVVGNPNQDNPFYLQRWRNPVGWVTGNIGFGYDVQGYAVINSVFCDTSGLLIPSAAATRAMARTNPSRPEVDITLFLAELKDIPRQIKGAGEILSKISQASRKGKVYKPTIRDGADQYLSYQFGWAPLISDLLKMFDFTKSVERRANELRRLYSDQGLKRRVTVNEGSIKGAEYTLYTPSIYSSSTVHRFQNETRYKQWVTLTWRTDEQMPFGNSDDIISEAKKLVFGQHGLHFDTIWNLLPWSWAMDWWTTAGDYFAAQRNHLGAYPTDINVMTHCTCRIWNLGRVSGPLPSAHYVHNNKFGHETKERVPYSGGPVIAAYLPILTEKQLSILAALSVLRMK